MYVHAPPVHSHARLLENVMLAAVALLILAALAWLTLRAISIEDAYATRRSILMQEAPETLIAPRRADFSSDACFARAAALYAERGDWATEDGNYSEMELCD